MKYRAKLKPKRDQRIRISNAKRAIIGVTVIALLAFIWVMVDLLSSPSVGHNLKSSIKLSTSAPSTSQTLSPSQPVDSSYFSLNLPAGYVSQSKSTGASGIELYTQTITGTSAEGSQIIAIGVTSIAEGGLTSSTSYEQQVRDPGEYIKQTETYNGQQVIIFTDNQTGNVIAFWPEGGYLATISASSGYQDPLTGAQSPELQVVNSMLANWHWKV